MNKPAEFLHIQPTDRPRVNCSVVIATFGANSFWLVARDLAWKIIDSQYIPPHEVICVHGETLAEARNYGAEVAETDWLIFLDADDDLDPLYCYEMMQGEGDIRRPSVIGFQQEEYGRVYIDPEPVMGSRYPLIQRNFLIVGCMVNRDIFLHVGGFDEWPVLEDWAMWLKCVCFGDASIEDVPKAIYRINDNHGRNKHPDIDKVAKKIRSRYSAAYLARKGS